MYKLKTLPSKGHLVLCTVTEVADTFIRVDLDEYENVSGVIPIDEVSHKRIRSLKKFVEVGKKIVCKVLDVDENNRLVTLSLKRVSEGEKMLKTSEYKKEKQAYTLLEYLSTKYNISMDEIEKEIIYKILETGEKLHIAFEKIFMEKERALKKYNIKKKYHQYLLEIIQEKIKPRIYKKKCILIIQSLAPDGIRKIKETLQSLQRKFNAKIHYISAANYEVELEDYDPKKLDKNYKSFIKEFEQLSEKNNFYYDIEEK